MVCGLFGTVSAWAQDGTASGATTFDVKIVHTNDIHARVEEDDYNQVIGMDRLSGIAQKFTEEADGSLMLDSGDTFHGQSIATLVKGESVAKLMKTCGYDAMTTGNHDWSYGKDRLKELGQIANVKILSGNVVNADGTVHVDYQKTTVDYAEAQNYDKDASVTAILDEIKAENATELNRVIGISPAELDGVWEHIRIGQTNLGNVITDAYLLATGADVAFENAGGIRSSIAAGTVTYGDVINVSPYGNYVVTKGLTGAQIREMLETSITIQKNCIVANDSGEWDAWPNDSGSYLQVGGITVSYDPAQPEGERVLSVKKDGQELDNSKIYTVAVNNYLADSDSYPQLAEASEIDNDTGKDGNDKDGVNAEKNRADFAN